MVIDDLTRLGNLFISSVMFIMFLFTGITIQEVLRQTKDLEEPCCDKVMNTLCPWFKEWCDTLDPSFSFSATTINRYSSIVTPASNNPNPTNSSEKYHKMSIECCGDCLYNFLFLICEQGHFLGLLQTLGSQTCTWCIWLSRRAQPLSWDSRS